MAERRDSTSWAVGLSCETNEEMWEGNVHWIKLQVNHSHQHMLHVGVPRPAYMPPFQWWNQSIGNSWISTKKKQTGHSMSKSSSWNNTSPAPTLLASNWMLKYLSSHGAIKMGTAVNCQMLLDRHLTTQTRPWTSADQLTGQQPKKISCKHNNDRHLADTLI